MAQLSPMNGGDGINSYMKNSTYQRDVASVLRDAMKEAMDNLNIEKLLRGSTTFMIADLGCSVGPNTFMTMQTLIETVEHKYHEQALEGSRNLEFQALFNDLTANDFNTLFASLPHPKNYYAAGVPGSFHDRLFPSSSSIHVAYSSGALHYLSKVPEELRSKDSPAWNAGRISYIGAPDAVVKAYADQLEADMEIFMRARAEEIVAGGMMIIIMSCAPQGRIEHGTSVVTTIIELILMDMVKEGLVEKEKVDLFNFPSVPPSIKDVRRMFEKNGNFEIMKIELHDYVLPINGDGEVDAEWILMLCRAAIEGTFANHFGDEIVDQLFMRAMQQKHKCSQIFHSSGITTFTHLFAALKRK